MPPPPLASLLSPLVVSAQADQRFPAEKVVGTMLLTGAVFQFFAFRELEIGQRPWLFLLLLGLNSLITAPAFGLLNTITLVYLRGTSERFGYYRVWGSLGWIAAGWLVSGLAIDSSPTTGYLSVGREDTRIWLLLFSANDSAVCVYDTYSCVRNWDWDR